MLTALAETGAASPACCLYAFHTHYHCISLLSHGRDPSRCWTLSQRRRSDAIPQPSVLGITVYSDHSWENEGCFGCGCMCVSVYCVWANARSHVKTVILLALAFVYDDEAIQFTHCFGYCSLRTHWSILHCGDLT